MVWKQQAESQFTFDIIYQHTELFIVTRCVYAFKETRNGYNSYQISLNIFANFFHYAETIK